MFWWNGSWYKPDALHVDRLSRQLSSFKHWVLFWLPSQKVLLCSFFWFSHVSMCYHLSCLIECKLRTTLLDSVLYLEGLEEWLIHESQVVLGMKKYSGTRGMTATWVEGKRACFRLAEVSAEEWYWVSPKALAVLGTERLRHYRS